MNRCTTRPFIACTVVSLTLSFMLTTACNTGEAIAALSAAANDLYKNRSLTEQYVRDLKATLEPSDPAYQQMLANYQEARNAYNHFLQLVELGARAGKLPPGLLSAGAEDARTSAAEFLSGATRTLAPGLSERRIPFQKAIAIPPNLPEHLHRLPEKYRTQLLEQLNDARWRAWQSL